MPALARAVATGSRREAQARPTGSPRAQEA